MERTDQRLGLEHAPMRWMQVVAVALCVLLNALDGFDVLAISFASPGIAAEWGVDRAALGLVLSMELIGMAVGSIALGALADRIGRRPTILMCLVVMAAGMAAAPLAWGVAPLSAVRFVTGLGIGGMLACTNAMVAEYANARNRALAVTIMAAGYPVGAIIGGSIASLLLASGGWRDVFVFGAITTTVFLPLTWLMLPESVGYLAQSKRPDALARLNATLARIGHARVADLPPTASDQARPSLGALFSPTLRVSTVLLTAAYFAHIMTFYFILKWIPKIVVDMGYPPSSAGGVLVWANVGGLAGALLLSVLTRRAPLRGLMLAAFAGSIAMVIWFGQGGRDLAGLRTVAAMTGFFTNAGVVGLYALIAQAFPTALRGGGTGFVIGMGRGGAALGPIVAGALFASGVGLPMVAVCMALGSVIAAVALLALGGGRQGRAEA
jgi:benzoate transport